MSMTKTAFLFPGQGSQIVGMATKLSSESKVARAILAQIDEALGYSLSSLMTNGPAEELQLTYNAQPALFASSLATLKTLQSISGQ